MKKTHIVLLIIVGITIAIIISLSNDYTSYETFHSALQKPDKAYHIVGTLVREKPLVYEPKKDPNYFSFYMEDADGVKRKVVYRGAKPQDFERSDKIVITAKPLDDYFLATHILMKCPSKYVNEEIDVNHS